MRKYRRNIRSRYHQLVAYDKVLRTKNNQGSTITDTTNIDTLILSVPIKN